MRITTILAAAAAAVYPVYAADSTSDSGSSSTATGVEQPSTAPTLGVQTVQGCFSDQGSLKLNSTPQYNTIGKCAHDLCYVAGYKVGASSGGNECYCGNEYPAKDKVVDDSKCDTPCPGYGSEACGGVGYYTVYNTGLSLNVDSAENSTDSSSSAAGTVVASSTVVSGGQTSVVYVTASASNDANAQQKSSSTGAIVGGVVAGVAAVGIAAGVIFFFMRRRRNREIEEEHRRNAAVNAFMKPPGSSGGYSVDTDARMDPVMAQRRLSSGSIADNQDYSRRILRVTNA